MATTWTPQPLTGIDAARFAVDTDPLAALTDLADRRRRTDPWGDASLTAADRRALDRRIA